MFESIKYLQKGNQKRAYQAISELDIMKHLAAYNPILCGTLPIGIDIACSDLDIIMEVDEFERFEEQVRELYGNQQNFKVKKLHIRENPVIKANFWFSGFEFELFGQALPVKEQNAYLHMVIEDAVMKRHPSIKKEVIELKEKGWKTEPAFCKVLQLEEGDPYKELINYGKNTGFI
ncbi:DUF4269 domain-containing protein [Salinibacillus xinjiangensis]|uniref:DUF4269 domain-containing protein n=1 Tax=Salinibacillus xinjiangensis TaxID=1229268 RepID=A0A6G1X891_9BACI|nr:DUF4269 domain-containing protein [Salinibacillus xinjiangensis]MRG87149.1 DUF4269 domain-containing protein [Salinibacillus xinjiangensis]